MDLDSVFHFFPSDLRGNFENSLNISPLFLFLQLVLTDF